MARQATTPVQFNLTTRVDDAVCMTSGRAGKVVPVTYFPVLRGESASGRIGVDIDLAEMPRPLLNAVHANVQAWFVPKTAHPQFSGPDEFMHSYVKEPIKALGAADRTPPAFFQKIEGASLVTAAGSEFFKTLGLHVVAGTPINSDLIDAFVLIYNTRLAAHSSKLPRRKYSAEDLTEATTLPRAFWPSGAFGRVVPDYERALIVGALDLDVSAGRIPVSGLGFRAIGTTALQSLTDVRETSGSVATYNKKMDGEHLNVRASLQSTTWANAVPEIYAEMTGTTVGITLADIDKARTTQAFAKLRAAYAGTDNTGFQNDDAILATLMQGFSVPEEQFKRPWLLDSQRVPVGFAERNATDAANLDKSVTTGRASVSLSCNIPRNDVGGVVIVTVEVLPERLYERQSDEWLHITDPDALPNALRDVQRVEPVDLVQNRRIDAKHSTPNGLYGYEPMNEKWQRRFTRLGGSFYQATPGAAWTEQRSAIWQVDEVDPAFNASHYLCPAEFPHGVFADTAAPAFEVVARHLVQIVGLTQFGDVLAENSDDYAAVQSEV